MKKILHILLLNIVFVGCQSQNKQIDLKDLNFESIFASSEKDSLNVYCLLGTGFFRAPSSEDSGALIQSWLEKNNDARVIVVSTIVDKKNNINYCWIINKEGETINEYLIKNGCFPGGTMMRPPTYREMSAKERKFYSRDEKPNIIVSVEKDLYDAFIERIKKAETYAKDNNLGIWKK